MKLQLSFLIVTNMSSSLPGDDRLEIKIGYVGVKCSSDSKDRNSDVLVHDAIKTRLTSGERTQPW